jgi:hypothetical protein
MPKFLRKLKLLKNQLIQLNLMFQLLLKNHLKHLNLKIQLFLR